MIDLTPTRFHALYAELKRQRAEDRLFHFKAVQFGLSGGRPAAEHEEELKELAELTPVRPAFQSSPSPAPSAAHPQNREP